MTPHAGQMTSKHTFHCLKCKETLTVTAAEPVYARDLVYEQDWTRIKGRWLCPKHGKEAQ